MNLEELQIKIGIELKELNKQLKQASDDINKTLGPKATKKMMTDNNKVIKDGFKVMEKTTKDSAKQINRDLNNAFDIDKTLVKFNKSIDRSMEQAKRSVRSACNDIRRELNAALNVRANIRVSASASAQRQSLGAKSDAAVIMASVQYNGAMIIKAINAMIGTNNKNTARLEGAVNKSTNKIVSAINKLETKKSQSSSHSKSEIQTDVKANIKVLEDGLRSGIDKAIQSAGHPEIEATIKVNADGLQNEVNKAIQSVNAPIFKTSVDIKTDGLQNDINKAIREVDAPSFKTGIEIKTSGLQNEINNIIKAISASEIKVPVIISADELQNEVNKAIRDVDAPNIKTTIEVDSSNLQNEINDIIRNIKASTIKIGVEALYKQPEASEDKGPGSSHSSSNKTHKPNGMQGGTGNLGSSGSSRKDSALKGEVIDPEVVPVEVFEQIQDIIDGINYKVKDFETGLVKVNNKATSVTKTLDKLGISKTGDSPLRGEVIDSGKLVPNKGIQHKEVIIPTEFKVIDDELQEQINDAVKKIKIPKLLNTKNFELGKEGILDTSQINALKQVHELKQKINNTPLRLDEPTEDYKKSEFAANELHRQIVSLIQMSEELNSRFRQTPVNLERAAEDAKFLEEAFEAVLKGAKQLNSVVPDIARSFDFGRDVLDDMAPGVRSLVKEIQKAASRPQRPDGFVPKQGVPGQVTKPQRPDGYNPTPGVEKTLSSEIIDVDAIKSVTSKAIKEFDDIRSELESLDFKVIEESLIDIGDYVEPLKKQLEPVTKELLKVEAIDDEKISLNLDASDAKEQLRITHEMYEDLIEACKTKNLNELKKVLGAPEQTEQPKQTKGPAKRPRTKYNHSSNRNRFNRPPEDYLSITSDDDDDIVKRLGGVFNNKGNNTGSSSSSSTKKPTDKKSFDDYYLEQIKKMKEDMDRRREEDPAKFEQETNDAFKKVFSREQVEKMLGADKADEIFGKVVDEAKEAASDIKKIFSNLPVLSSLGVPETTGKGKQTQNGAPLLPGPSSSSNLPVVYSGKLEEVKADVEKIEQKAIEATNQVTLAIGDISDSLKQETSECQKALDNTLGGKKLLPPPLKLDTEQAEDTFKQFYNMVKNAKMREMILDLSTRAAEVSYEDFYNMLKNTKMREMILDLNTKQAEMSYEDFYNILKNTKMREMILDLNTREAELTFDDFFNMVKNSQPTVDLKADIDKNTADMFKALQQPGAFLPGAFKEVARLKKAINNLGGGSGGGGPRLPGSGSGGNGGSGGNDGGDIDRISESQFNNFFNQMRLFRSIDMSQLTGLFGRNNGAMSWAFKLHMALTKFEAKALKVFRSIKTKAAAILSKVATPLKNAFNKVYSPIKKAANKIVTTFRKVVTNIKGFGSVIKYHINKAFTGIKSTKLYTSVAKGLNKAKAAVSKFAGKVKPILNKAFSGIKIGAKVASNIGKGLSKAKGILSKFAGSCKTIWGKIKGIFSKGASDASKATGKLTTGLKALLAQAMGFFSLYALINLGKQAITQSQTLAQSEVKLTALMKQRMGATNETVRAIRNLAKEQANLGVVSEAAMVRGAEQLSMYVHSAKALEKLMPAIANMTARRGGFNATEDDAEEIATQLGEAIREGTTTPLEQSGIYLSEAEIKKFQALRTEEERAAYLADVIAKNVGNINEALANTPHGQIAQLKNNFKSLLGTLGTLLVNVIQPIVKWLNVIVVAANNALKALGELLGFDMTGGGLSGVDLGTGSAGTPGTSGVDNVTDSYENAADAADKATEANEKFKGSLMGFDEINILSDNTNKNSGSEEDDPTNITPGEGGQLDPGEYIPTEMTEGENIFTKFGEKMKAFLDEFLEPFKAAWDLLGDDLKAEWADLIESFKHFCDSLGSFLKSVWDHGGKEFVQHMAEIGLACAKAAMEIGGEILDSLARLWEHLDPAHNKHTQGFLDALNETSVKLRDFILGLGDHFESLMANGGQDVLNAMGDCFMDLGNAAVTGLGLAIDALDGLIDHLDPANNEITRNMLKSWEDAFHAIGQCALDFVDFLDSVLKNGGQDVINALGDAFVSLVGLVGDVVKEVSEAFSGLFKHLDPETNQFTKDFLKAWEDAFNSIADMFGSFGDFLGSVMDNGGQELLNSVGDLGMKLGEAFGVIVDECAKTLSELFTHMDPATNPHSKKMLDSLDGLVDSITKFVDACIDAFKRFMDNGGREFVTNLGDILAIVIDLAAELGSGIIDVITAFINSWAGQTLIEGVAQALAWVSEKLVGLADSFDIVKDMFHNIVDMIIAVFEGDGEKLGQAFAKLIKNTFKLTGELVVWLGEVAADLIKGLVKGICALPGLLWEAVKFIFDAIVGFFKELFGIHSPSTVFADLGKNLIEGLVKGVTDCVNLVTGAFKKVCDAITNTIKDISKAVSDKFKEIKEGISEKLKETKEVVSEKWSEIKTTVSEKAKETYDAARDNWANLKQTVSERARETYEAVKGNWENLKQNTADRFKETYDVAQERFTNIREAIKEKATKTFEDVSNSWTKIKEDAGNKLEQIKTDAEKRYEDVKNTLVNKIEEAKKGIVEKWEEVRNKTNECIENVRQTSEEKYNEIKETIVNRLEDIKSSTEKKWEEIKKNTGTAVENIKKEAEEQYGKIKDSLLDTLEKTKSAMATKWENIKTDAINKVSEIVKQATTKFGEIKKNFGDKLDEVKSSLTSKWKSLSTQAFNGAKDLVSQAKSGLSKIGSTISDAITGSKSKVRSALNEVGKVFSQADWSLPKLKMPHIKITGKWGFNPPSWPKFSVEWYKRGGIIDGITPLGMTGGTMHMAGEAGKEMVVPLENTSFTTKIAKAMGQAVDNAMARNNNNNNNNSNPFVNNNGDIILQVDGREFARCSINQINKLQRESGRTLLDV